MTARQVLAAIAEGDVLRTNLAALRRLLKTVPADTVAPPAGRRHRAARRYVCVAAKSRRLCHRHRDQSLTVHLVVGHEASDTGRAAAV